MPSPGFAAELARYGPGSTTPRSIDAREARDYCRDLAVRHYENFTVASWLLPERLRPHFYHVYAYCRWSDDLADETGGGRRSLELLQWWEEQLEDCYRGRARHPVFVALCGTIEEFQIPIEPFRDLLKAFRQDQTTIRYESWDELLAYCRYSANPVGRLVLYLGRAHDDARGALADQVCTGLQLANFWQDVHEDWNRGRIYLPLSLCRQHGYSLGDFESKSATPAFRALLADVVTRAEGYLRAGQPLVPLVPRELRLDVDLFIEGGLAILRGIRSIDYDVWRRRPEVSKWQKLMLVAKCWWRRG